jgi:hypothetical protein
MEAFPDTLVDAVLIIKIHPMDAAGLLHLRQGLASNPTPGPTVGNTYMLCAAPARSPRRISLRVQRKKYSPLVAALSKPKYNRSGARVGSSVIGCLSNPFDEDDLLACIRSALTHETRSGRR